MVLSVSALILLALQQLSFQLLSLPMLSHVRGLLAYERSLVVRKACGECLCAGEAPGMSHLTG